ncbi:hypothetical protein T08_13028 [Trichinella sp. T8]|nr:hypothetical protein T08_13028 [Trichinella sp. T8]
MSSILVLARVPFNIINVNPRLRKIDNLFQKSGILMAPRV